MDLRVSVLFVAVVASTACGGKSTGEKLEVGRTDASIADCSMYSTISTCNAHPECRFLSPDCGRGAKLPHEGCFAAEDCAVDEECPGTTHCLQVNGRVQLGGMNPPGCQNSLQSVCID
jgi:hypothetical protein